MNASARRSLLLAVAAVCLLVASAFAQDSGRTFHWQGKLAADQTLTIKNINGAIDANGASGDQIDVTAEKSGARADEVQIKVEQSSNGVTICAIYPGNDSNDCSSHWGHSNGGHGEKAKVDFRVSLPKNLRFNAEDVNGSVSAQGMGRPVHASSVNGGVRVSTASWAEASSVNGSVECSMGAADWTGKLKIETVNGSVRLELPADANTDVKFSSVNGRLNSEFPVTISGVFGSHSAHGTIGSGGRELSVETVNGSVELTKRAGI
jgi:DUF4097 and DUF4098 domain-containing protein YvlB